MENVNLNQLTSEQKGLLLAELKQEEIAKEKQKENTKVIYKTLVNDIVEEVFPDLVAMSNYIEKQKKKVFDSFDTVINLKREVYTIKDDQKTHTFSNKNNTKRITIGYRTLDHYDDTANAGLEKINQYLDSLITDGVSKKNVSIISSLLKRDEKGNLQASRVVELYKLINEIDNELFTEGVKIIMEAAQPSKSVTFITADCRDENNKWRSIPLSVSSV